MTTDPLQATADYLGQTVEEVEATSRWLGERYRALLAEPPFLTFRAGSAVGKSFGDTGREVMHRAFADLRSTGDTQASLTIDNWRDRLERESRQASGSAPWVLSPEYFDRLRRDLVALDRDRLQPPRTTAFRLSPIVVRLALEGR